MLNSSLFYQIIRPISQGPSFVAAPHIMTHFNEVDSKILKNYIRE